MIENSKFKIQNSNFVRKMVSRFSFSAVQIFLIISLVSAQSGVLISTDEKKPNPKMLSLAVMNVEITIDNQHATVKVMQIFDNHTDRTLEGKYVFALPQKSSISDFAVWENESRIPGVMMERRRANRVYGEIKQAQTDPGILQETDETESANGFSAKIFPINSYGTKRLEMEYTEDLPVDNLASHFTFPLKPTYGESQTVGEFNLKIRVLNDFPFAPLQGENPLYQMQITKNDENDFAAEFHAANIHLENDFAFDYKIKANENQFSVVAYRAPERISAYDLRDPNLAERSADGFFQTSALFAGNRNQARPPKRVILMLDTSLSMYGDKLSRAVEAADFFLHNLAPEDEFNLILFNGETDTFAPKPVSATSEKIENALQFVKEHYISGGTNLKKAFEKTIEQTRLFSNGEKQIVLISDANPTLETTDVKQIEKVFDGANVRLFAFALGVNADENLLKSLTEKTHGFYDSARETEDIAVKLNLFFDKIGAPEISNLQLAQSKNFYDVYATDEHSYFGSNFSFVGRYKNAQTENFTLTGNFGAENLNFEKSVALPELDETHGFLPRVWARAKVDFLIALMNRDGEREDYISEIIRLSEKYKFVTPYTAFVAAPRALLRPRLIQPGDPVIRVKADESVKEIAAVLPFGEVIPLKFLKNENIWEARFLAPIWMTDGTYKCRLILTDGNGAADEEEKSFVIDSRAPKVSVSTDAKSYKAGEEINLKVSADADTNRLIARIYGAKPVSLIWSNKEKSNIGKLKIPENIVSGKYKLTVSAEDFAHNQTTEETMIEILGN